MQRDLGITFIHVTHSQDEALALATVGVVMNEGRIEQFASPINLFNKPVNVFVADFVGGHNILEFDDYTYSLRTDRLTISELEKGQKKSKSTYTVKDIEFLGNSVNITVSNLEQFTLKANLPDRDFYKNELKIGQNVKCKWNKTDLHKLSA